mgnify:CR=1 FL=1
MGYPAAGACDAVYGDSFTRDGSRVLGIGNNVSLLFDRMDFGETGCCGIRITGRSPLPANTVHLMFAAADGGETERRVVEFGPQADWGEQTFTFEPSRGRGRSRSSSCPARSLTLIPYIYLRQLPMNHEIYAEPCRHRAH